MPLRILLFVLCGCLLAGPAWALDPGKSFRHYLRDTWSTEDGLPQVAVLSIAQTPDGYLWLGSQAGLARFNGLDFTSFTPADEPAFPHPMIEALEVDGAGALWIGTGAGLVVLRDGGFHRIPWTGDGDAPMIYGLHVADDGRVWAATMAGAAYVEDGRLRPLSGMGAANAVLVTSDGVLWVASSNGVTRWNGREWLPTQWPGGNALLATDLLLVEGEVWAATINGFHVHGPAGWRPVPGATDDGMALRFGYRDGDGNVWGGSDYGLVRVRPDGGVETIAATEQNGLSNLLAAFEDREGSLWMGSLSTGLSQFRNGWTRHYGVADGLPDPGVWGVAPDAGGEAVWAGTNDGVARLGRDGRFTPIGVSGAVPSLLSEPGQLWIGLNPGVASYRPDSGGAVATPEWARDLRAGVLGFSRDAEGHLWLGVVNALLRWDGATLERFGENRGLTSHLAEYRLLPLQDGRRLAVATNGLFEFDGQAFQPAPEGRDLPEGVVLHAFTQLSDGRLLLSDLGNFLLLRHGGRWHRIDETAGLIPALIHQIIEHDGYLWMPSLEGLYRLRIDELTAFAEGRLERIRPQWVVSAPGMPNGGQRGICCNGAGLHDGFLADGTLWLPASNGVLAVDIDDIRFNPHPPTVQLGRVQVGDAWRTLAPDAPVLAADERDLTLAFDVLGFQDARSNQARYRLVGYDRDWQDAEALARQVRYTNLPPGDYVFEVLASNNHGLWMAEPARLEFSIHPYFHETLAFRLLVAALALLLVYAGYRYQRHRHRLRQAELERLVDERTEELARSNEQLGELVTQLEEATVTDPLTGLRNRRYLTAQLPPDLNYYDRQLAGGPPRDEAVVFAMLDLDHFKQVNDVHGHAVGDRVLEETGRRLKGLVRAGDYVVRWGGEEFLLVFRPMPSDQVPVVGERLRAAMAEAPFEIGDGRSIRLTASVGLSEYPRFCHGDQPLDWEAMIELADQAAYHVKRNGRNGWAMFRPTAATRMATLLADLQRDPPAMLARGELELLGSVVPAPR